VGLKQLRAIEQYNLVLAAVICLASLIFWQRGIALGAFLGAGLAVVNFWAIRRVSEAGLKTKSERKRLVLISFLLAKMGALIALVYLAIRYLPINVLAFLVGLSTFLISIMIVSFRGHADTAET
jgi:Na+(H+)/acetate symporter ActP